MRCAILDSGFWCHDFRPLFLLYNKPNKVKHVPWKKGQRRSGQPNSRPGLSSPHPDPLTHTIHTTTTLPSLIRPPSCSRGRSFFDSLTLLPFAFKSWRSLCDYQRTKTRGLRQKAMSIQMESSLLNSASFHPSLNLTIPAATLTSQGVKGCTPHVLVHLPAGSLRSVHG